MSTSIGALATAILAAFATNASAVTLDDYLSQVRRTHPLFEREALRVDVDAARVQSLLGREDWLLESSPSYTHSDPVRSSPFEPERVDFLHLGAAAGRAFWSNGARMRVEWSSDLLDQNLPGFTIPTPAGVVDVPVGPSTFYTHMLRATVSLPLLKNRGGSLDRLDRELAQFDVDLAALSAAENQEAFLGDVALKFLDWAFAEEQLRIGRERLGLAEEELDRARRKRASYLVDAADVLRAEDAVYQARNAVMLVESRWNAARAELAALAAQRESELDAPTFDVYERPQPPRLEDISGDISATRVVHAVDVQRRQLGVLLAGSEEATRPALSLAVSGTLLGGDDEFDGSLEMTHSDVTVGLELRYPLGNRSAEADLTGTRLRLRQLDLARSEVEVSLTSGMRAVVVQLASLSEVLDLNRERVETAGRKTQEELSLYNQGRGDLTFVIQSRDNEALAKLVYAENSILYHKLLLQYRALSDRLLSGGNIE